MQNARIAIIGGGLSGLYAAFLLEQHDIHDYVLFEARSTLGGRILSASPIEHQRGDAPDILDRFDLGPTWFWPEVQPELDQLISDLGLERFKQYETGDMLIEHHRNQTPTRTRGFPNTPASMRLVGGMAALIDALKSRINVKNVFTSEAVHGLRHSDAGVDVCSLDADGKERTIRVDHVLLALPPRLLESTIRFEPALPVVLAQSWRNTATWMAPHAKYVAVFTHPFWREQYLSGEARSFCGPLAEIHDASMEGGSAALFGFVGLPANVRTGIEEEVLRTHCRAQLTRLFGPEAAMPDAEFVKDWSRDPHTAVASDIESSSQHPVSAAASGPLGPWSTRITGIASEWSRSFPGYLAGAIEAAYLGVQSQINLGDSRKS